MDLNIANLQTWDQTYVDSLVTYGNLSSFLNSV